MSHAEPRPSNHYEDHYSEDGKRYRGRRRHGADPERSVDAERYDADAERYDPDLERDERYESDGTVSVAEQRRRLGGVKPGSAFFGWLTAMGMSVLLTALISAAGAGVAIGTQTDPTKLANQGPTVGIAGAIAVAVILFVAYYCGGYVAGRMARFDGARQGIAVWLWAVVIAIILAIVVAVAGSQFNVLSSLNSFPRIPVDEGTLTTGGVVVLIVAALIALVGAVLGGLAGMHFHRKIDRAVPQRSLA